MSGRLRLGFNIDHVATLRNARGGAYPDPIRAAQPIRPIPQPKPRVGIVIEEATDVDL